jgi:hypothetical protein
MGTYALRRPVRAVAIAATLLVCTLNVLLLMQLAGVPIPFLPAGG